MTTGVAERIRSRTKNTLISLAPGITDWVTVSIGIASAPDEGHDRVTLLRLADEALYRAKQAGRNRIQHISGVGPAVGTKATPVLASAPVNGRTPRRKAQRSASA